jgi:hypothetical protein
MQVKKTCETTTVSVWHPGTQKSLAVENHEALVQAVGLVSINMWFLVLTNVSWLQEYSQRESCVKGTQNFMWGTAFL